MLKDRAFQVLNLKQYSEVNGVDDCGDLELDLPKERQYILRMLIKRMFGEYQLPKEVEWVRPLLEITDKNQKEMESDNLVYLTIRNGIVNTQTDDEWHVDGFSQTITHLPEQNYLGLISVLQSM